MTTDEALRILDLAVPITREGLSRAYEQAALVWHPERFAGNPGLQAKAAAKLEQMNEAYACLAEGLREGAPLHLQVADADVVRPRPQKMPPPVQMNEDGPYVHEETPPPPPLGLAPMKPPPQMKPKPSALTMTARVVAGVGGVALLGVLAMLFSTSKRGDVATPQQAAASAAAPAVPKAGVSASAAVASAAMKQEVAGTPSPAPACASVSLWDKEPSELRAYAELGEARAQYWLAVTCFRDLMMAADPSVADLAEAMKWFRLAAEQGLPDAQHQLGRAYLMGVGVDKDAAEGVKWLQRAAMQGFTEAQSVLGVELLKQKKNREAAGWFLHAARAGYGPAQFHLGQMLRTGDGVAVERLQAYTWLTLSLKDASKAGQERRAETQRALDELLQKMTSEEAAAARYMTSEEEKAQAAMAGGSAPATPAPAPARATTTGTPEPATEKVRTRAAEQDAFVWAAYLPKAQLYTLACQGDAEAQRHVGRCYANGEGGFQRNLGEAAVWMRLAAEKNNGDAQMVIGRGCRFGVGVPQDDVAATGWFRKAAEQGRTEAMRLLGEACFTGLGMPVNQPEAMKWFSLAFLRGDESAEGWMAKVERTLTPQQIQEAKRQAAEFRPSVAAPAKPKWRPGMALTHEQALAEKGDAEAQFNLGMSFSKGVGVVRNDAEAVRWFGKAAEKGHAHAQLMLADALRTGTGTAQDAVAAAGWYRKAAEQRITEAEYRLGLCLESGAGVPQDRAAAVPLFLRAAAQGHAYAQTKAGLACLTGEGVRKDALEAAIWFGLALSGDPAADALFTKAHDQLTQTQIGDLYQRMNDFFSDNHRELAASKRPAP